MTSPCPECGFNYVPELSSNRRAHRKYHDETGNGLPRKPYGTDEVVDEFGLDRVLLVTPKSAYVQRRRAQDVSVRMSDDIPGSGNTYCCNEAPNERDLHIFLGSRSDRLVAYMAMERRQHIWRCTWPQYEDHDIPEVTDRLWMWSVGVAWVSRNNRRQGWTRRLIAAASSRLEIGPDEYGWYTPFSSDGEAVVRALHPEFFYIAK